MSGVNKVILVGRAGKDPEVRHLEGGANVAKFSLATSETYKKPDGTKVETTEWHNIVLWRGLADVAERFVRKGSQVYIEGKIRSRTWDDKDGVKRYAIDIVADNMTLLGRKPEDANTNTGTSASSEDAKTNFEAPPVAAEPETGDDLPF
ncbi:MAG TPA: single-stranded DNA-binding protein [Bacteroidia bacterium]|nr:single-stranded DNA-binding protein [Bacteroidia bacterium]